MAINPDNLATRARELLTQQAESESFSPERVFAVIPLAVAEWVSRVRNDPQKRRNFLAETDEIEIANGVADCFEKLSERGIQSQFVEPDNVVVTEGSPTMDVLADEELTVCFVNSRARLRYRGIQDRFFLTAFFDGKKMFFADTELSGSLKIRAVCVPVVLTDIPQSVEGELATILAEMLRKLNADSQSAGAQINASKAMRKN